MGKGRKGAGSVEMSQLTYMISTGVDSDCADISSIARLSLQQISILLNDPEET